MTAAPVTPPIFDGHNDQLSKLLHDGDRRAFADNPGAAIDVARANTGGFAGGLFAIWIPSAQATGIDFGAMAAASFDVPLPDEVPRTTALPVAMAQIAILLDLERQGHLRICRTAAEIRSTMANNVMAAVLHMEGAEAIDEQLDTLDVFHAAGLRSLGPVWSRPNRFGHGVPFRFPGSPDTGPGLTPAGVRLVEHCNARRIMVDLSHITEAGFWDVARISKAPLVASHSNAHALCTTTRNLTDRQLSAIAETGGLVGINFAAAFLREDGRMSADVPLSRVLEHADYLIERLGEDGVGFGSDYDGAVVPAEISGVERLPRLRQAMADRGYGPALIAKLCHENWVGVLERTWGA
ncbi:dipeptidase [Acuticoccus sp. MNP-M23]|uniref:dipeptidase n=1 Tax=Acuticoccus sp. MNP-M23 TaxID=3072793 RepID=UPI0028169089|nr:dipeptidase [Acuticoccus sp. MNP-M23]WMS41209.1 dipeptidase [Acuticoccus sp. MNP-M23]